MHLHAHLIAPLAGAVLGLPLFVVLAWLVSRKWPRLPKRRRWVLSTALATFGCAYVLAIYAFFIEPNALVIYRRTIVSDAWRGPPLIIAAISDVHVRSPHVSAKRVGRVVARINALRPDLVVLLGDYANTFTPAAARSPEARAEIQNGIASFGALDARYGAVSVLGNHDDWYGRTAIAEALEGAGVAVLRNRHAVIARPGGRFAVVGLTDANTDRPDYARAIDGASSDAPIIAIMHNPDSFPQIPVDVALTLAGHTHCGQVTAPFLGRPIVPSDHGQKYACHLIEERGRKMLVTSGIGTSILPVRFLNPPEIALITLKAANPQRLRRAS